MWTHPERLETAQRKTTSIIWQAKDTKTSLSRVVFFGGFPGGSVVKNLLANAGAAEYVGLIPGLGRSPGGGKGSPLQYSCLGNPMALVGCTAHEVTKSQTQLRGWAYTHSVFQTVNSKSVGMRSAHLLIWGLASAFKNGIELKKKKPKTLVCTTPRKVKYWSIVLWKKVSVIMHQWFLIPATLWNYSGNFKKYLCLGPTVRNANSIGLGWGPSHDVAKAPFCSQA